MDELQEKWKKTLNETEIIRYRIKSLYTFKPTDIPYIFLAESSVNIGDTVIRKGRVIVHEASLILPPHYPVFENFDFEKDLHVNQDTIRTFFLLRGVTFPSYKYHHITNSIEIFEGPLKRAVRHFKEKLEQAEDTQTGLLTGPEDCWQLSVLIFVGSMVSKSAIHDVREILKELKKRMEPS